MSDFVDPSDGSGMPQAATPGSAEGAQTPGDQPSARLLRAVECIATHGPLTYEDLRQRIGVSKTATWRLVTLLREAGWVRLHHGGRLLQLDARLDDLFATARYSDREFAAVADLLALRGRDLAVHVDLFALGPQSGPVLIETTRRLTAGAGIDEADDAVMLAIEGAMTGPQLSRHLLRKLELAEPEQAEAIRSGAVRRHIRGMNGQVWAVDPVALSVSLRGPMGTPAALRLVPRQRGADRSVLTAALRLLRDALAGQVESFARAEGDRR